LAGSLAPVGAFWLGLKTNQTDLEGLGLQPVSRTPAGRALVAAGLAANVATAAYLWPRNKIAAASTAACVALWVYHFGPLVITDPDFGKPNLEGARPPLGRTYAPTDYRSSYAYSAARF
jgi:hypothetical protein